MHIALTDILTCPRCGPGFGLILLADRIEARRVHDGLLGCMNCRERYPVHAGFADLRPLTVSADGALSESGDGGAEPLRAPPEAGDGAFRLAALLGIHEGPGLALVAGPEAHLAPGIAAAVPDLEVVALHEGLATWAEAPGVSRLAASGTLPFFDRALAGVALTGGWAAAVEEGARVLAAGGRLVLSPVPPEAPARVAAAGLEVVATAEDTLVALRPEMPGFVQLGRR